MAASVCLAAMGKIDGHSVIAMRDNLVSLRGMTPLGARPDQVRGAVVMLRDIQQNFVGTWRYAQLNGMPRIAGKVLTAALPATITAIHFGAVELDPPAPNSITPQVITDDGTVLDGRGGNDFVLFGEGDLRAYWPPSGGADPFELQELGASAFFSGTIYLTDSVKVSRNDVIRYEAYRKGAVHSHASQYHADYPRQMHALDKLREIPPFHSRENVDYLLLSIARDVTASPDVGRFIAAVS